LVQLKESLAAAVALLAAHDVPSPRMNAELLLRFTLSCDRAYLFAHPERELLREEEARYQAVLAERSRGVPAQYITGHQEFWGMDLIVSPAVLIPRPETEHVIETVLALDLESRLSAGKSSKTRLRLVDVGTGSGAIALALAKELARAQVEGTDISPAALEIARANAARHQLDGRIRFHHTDLLEGLESDFDLVVSNPPYVGEWEQETVQLEVRKFEPRAAVFAGPAGTEVIERLISQAQRALGSGGWLVMEISRTIADRVRQLLAGWDEVEITPDLQSIPRVVRARKPRTGSG
jgi:release factor glutamine methyltransferase